MSSTFMILTGVVMFLLAYVLYGKFLSRRFRLSGEEGITPAHRYRDGVDYVPSRLPVVMGHHFASIAGAGPIVGPVLAIKYGWLPAFLWIILGSVFVGALHDFSSLVASLRHGGRSIAELIERYVGRKGRVLFAGFTFFALVLVIAVFADVVARTFVKRPQVASASAYFLISAVIFGLINYRLRLRGPAIALLAILFVVLSVFLGFQKGIVFSYKTWVKILMIYIYLAATAPVWVLLQPRDFLNSFILYALLGGSALGAILAGKAIKIPAFTSFIPNPQQFDFLFPFLFVTVACGAVSGFHSLVSSGTTAKQIDRETHALPVGYGMMLVEGLLALVALAGAGVLTLSAYNQALKESNPIMIFATGAGHFLEMLGLSFQTGVTLSALAVSAFALTSLDTSTRLARFVIEEVVIKEGSAGKVRFVSTFIAVALSYLLLLSGGAVTLWPLFGSANQLLAGLAFLGVYAWLSRTERFSLIFIRVPMYFVLAFTTVSLLLTGYRTFVEGKYFLTLVAGLLFSLAVLLILETKTGEKKEEPVVE